jgi:hypothetical protein
MLKHNLELSGSLFSLLLLCWRISPSDQFPFRITSEIVNLTDIRQDTFDGWSARRNAVTYTGQHKHNKRRPTPCLEQDPNPPSQCLSWLRHFMPQTARTLSSVYGLFSDRNIFLWLHIIHNFQKCIENLYIRGPYCHRDSNAPPPLQIRVFMFSIACCCHGVSGQWWSDGNMALAIMIMRSEFYSFRGLQEKTLFQIVNVFV